MIHSIERHTGAEDSSDNGEYGMIRGWKRAKSLAAINLKLVRHLLPLSVLTALIQITLICLILPRKALKMTVSRLFISNKLVLIPLDNVCLFVQSRWPQVVLDR